MTREDQGLLEELLGIVLDTRCDLDQGQKFPPVENYGAVVVLGGPDSANDESEKMKSELVRINEILAAKIPYLGICLGLRLLLKHLVAKSCALLKVGFIGPDGQFYSRVTEDGKQDPLFEGLDHKFNVFQLHGETVELTDSMALLGTGKFCRNQVVRVGSNAYGIQCHFELTPEMFEIWINEDSDLLELSKEQLRAGFAAIQEEYTSVGRKLLANFLRIAGF